MVDLARNFALKSSTAISAWLSTTALAHTPGVVGVLPWRPSCAASGGLAFGAPGSPSTGLALRPACDGGPSCVAPWPVRRRTACGGPGAAGRKPESVVVAVVVTPQSTPMAALASRCRHGLFRADHERGVPVAEAVLVDPDDWSARTAVRRDQTTGTVTLPAGRRSRPSLMLKPRVVYSRLGSVVLSFLTFGRPRPLTLNECVQRRCVGAQRLLLGDLGTLAQPARSGRGPRSASSTACRTSACGRSSAGGRPRSTGTGTGPTPRAAPPGRRAGPQTVGVTHRFLHNVNIGHASDTRLKAMNRQVCRDKAVPVVELDTVGHQARQCPPATGLRPAVWDSPSGQDHHGPFLQAPASSVPLAAIPASNVGPTQTSSSPSVAQPWRSQHAMSRANATSERRSIPPTAEARGFSGDVG